MAEQGKIFEIKDGMAKVSMQRHEACKDCHACDMGRAQEMILTATPLCDVKIGDTVEIHLENRDFLKATLIMYGIPLSTLILGFVVGFYLGNNFGLNGDIFGFILGLIFMLLTYVVINKNEEKWKSGDYTPVITKVVEK